MEVGGDSVMGIASSSSAPVGGVDRDELGSSGGRSSIGMWC